MIDLLIPKKTDAAASKSYIAQALISFLKDKDIDDISITDIVKKAGVSRMTYYRYFSSKMEVLESYLDIVIEDYTNNLPPITDNMYFSSFECIEHGVNYFKKYKDYILTLDKAKLSPIILNELTSFLNGKFGENTEANIDNVYISYYAGGLFNIYINWLKNDLHESEKELATKIYKITNSFIH